MAIIFEKVDLPLDQTFAFIERKVLLGFDPFSDFVDISERGPRNQLRCSMEFLSDFKRLCSGKRHEQHCVLMYLLFAHMELYTISDQNATTYQ